MSTPVFNTCGRGYWSKAVKPVSIVYMHLDAVDDERDEDEPEFGELRIFFDTATWNPKQDGLIYTDSQFLREMRAWLDTQGLPGNDVEYSEQGMQGFDFVSCDAGDLFVKAWKKKFSSADLVV